MKSPFPGMDPYLEHPTLWPDVHNRLIAAIADAVSPRIAPDYYVGLERRAYVLSPDDMAMIYLGRPDIAVIQPEFRQPTARLPLAAAGVYEIELLMNDEVSENYLEVREVKTGRVITVLELLSPANKLHTKGRADYIFKREYILSSQTHLVEIDLLRAGEPMPMNSSRRREGDYRIIVSRASHRPKALLYPFTLRQRIPTFDLPLLPGDREPAVELNNILHDLYERARFDLRLDYAQPPLPPLSEADTVWAQELT